jgi:hypothetical protein
MAPIRTGGMAMMIHPKAATYDNIWALPAVLLDNTLWKYTCNSIVNINTYSAIYGLLSKQIQSFTELILNKTVGKISSYKRIMKIYQ